MTVQWQVSASKGFIPTMPPDSACWAQGANLQEKETRKRLGVFLDGTWNKVSDNTNVWRLRSLCAPLSPDGRRQLSYYDIGVNGRLGGMFGMGLIDNVTQAYEWLVDNYEDGDEIFVFGFSRGAFTARSLTGLISKYGLLRAGGPLSAGQIYDRYRRRNDPTIRKLIELNGKGELTNVGVEERWMVKYAMPVDIKFIGVWDTVGSHGVPFLSIPGVSRSTFGWLNTGLWLCIKNAFHAVAIDEHRFSFSPTLWTVKQTTEAAPRAVDSVEQRWFMGAHGNVGGGYHSDFLAQRPLKWMKDRAEKAGLTFRYDVDVDADAITAPIADSHGEFLGGWYKRGSSPVYRSIGQERLVVEGVASSTINETIDHTVFERYRRDPKYRPRSITDWARTKKVEPEQINGSVRADNPAVSVPD